MDKKNKNPNVPNLRFKKYSNDWIKYKITDLGEMRRGKSKHRPRDDEMLYGGVYPFIQTGDIKKAYLYINEYEKTYSNYGLSQSKLWKKGTLCITIAANIAETAILSMDACFPDSVIGWCSNNQLTNNLFIKYYFDYYKEQLKRLSVGGAQENLNLDKLEKIYFNIPSLQEQNNISNFLSKIDERIQTQIKIIENLYSQRKCIFLHLNNNYQHNKIKINELGTVNIANNLSKDDLVDDGRKCILYGELFTKYDLYTTHIVSKTNKTYHTITSSGNDLLFPTSTTVNALSLIKPLALCQKDVILGGDMFSIKLNDTYNAIYISCLINYVYKKQLASKTQGTTIVHLYYENIKNEIIEICDYEIQYKIAEYIKFITSKIEIEKELLNKLHLQKTYLLRNLFI